MLVLLEQNLSKTRMNEQQRGEMLLYTDSIVLKILRCICIAESLHCSPITIITLLIGFNKKLKKILRKTLLRPRKLRCAKQFIRPSLYWSLKTAGSRSLV